MATATDMPTQVAAAIRTACNNILVQLNELEKKLAEVANVQDPVKQAVTNAPSIVKLNVGGTIFETSKDTLLGVEGSYFHALLGSGNWKPDATTNAYFLDMDPTLFRRVLFYLRTGTMLPVDGLTKPERDELKAMMKYLNVCPWEVATSLIRWTASKSPLEATVSNDLRTAQKTIYQYPSTVIATQALRGTFRIRIDLVQGFFFLGLCPMAGFDGNSSFEHSSYRYYAKGDVSKKESRPEKKAALQAGDVVAIQRGALDVSFTVNKGAPIQMPMDDPNEVLFPMVYMGRGATKVTIVD